MSVIEIISKYRVEFLLGLLTTLKLCSIIWLIGIIVGALLGIAGSKWKKAVGMPSRLASFVLSGVPILVLLFWLHYPLQSMLGVVIDPFLTAALALTTVNVFLVADTIRNAMLDFPLQFSQAAKVCGISGRDIVLRIQIPIILRQVLSGLLLIQVNMLQATLFASLISVDEIFRIAQRVNSEVYRPVEIYTALAFLFLIVCLPLNGLSLWLKAKYTRDFSEK